MSFHTSRSNSSDQTDRSDLPSSLDSNPPPHRVRSINPRALESVQNRLRSMGSHYRLSEDLIQWAQTLLDMPEEERWLMSILISLNSQIPPVPSVQPAAETAVSTGNTNTEMFHNSLRTFIRTQIRQILLRPDLQSYVPHKAKKDHVDMSPHGILMGILQQESDGFKQMYLPKDFHKDALYKRALDKLIADILKGEKSNLATMLRIGFGPEDPAIPPPKLPEIIGNVYVAMDPRFANKPITDIHKDSRITIA
ncbi:hypothetical protein PGT21_033741 [Puccinia graminis f. sp. tritici]|uniref:Uncharacterized protein n=1 Tax=Puccinia graminis f. sp. tritici TaxID=56615 RepID=A0A5B0M0F9_PUCGR|nr:hypothetical protein PGT21_033741 [Puccinia graminis f. sp. tritici]